MKLKNSIFLFFLLIVSCQLINLEQLELTSFPASKDGIISLDDPIWVEFNVPLNRASAENAFHITSYKGNQQGDFSWQENRLTFIPQPQWGAGRRYILSFQGQVESTDGRSFRADLQLPFYASTNNFPPELIREQSTGDGEIIGTADPLNFTFTKAIEQESFAKAFSLSPSTDFDILWINDSQVTISPQVQWNNFSNYTWSIKDTLIDTESIAIIQEQNGNFIVQEDDILPVIDSNFITAAITDWLTLFPDIDEYDIEFSRNLDNIQYKDSIKFRFSEPVVPSSVQEAIKITPSVEHSIQRLEDDESEFFVFIPTSGFVQGQLYHLLVERDVEDLSGNKMLTDYDWGWFTPAIDEVEVASIEVYSSDGIELTITDFNQVQSLPAYDSFKFAIYFDTSEFFGFQDPEEKAAVTDNISCSQFFPSSASLTTYDVTWVGDDTLQIGYSGFNISMDGKTYYYKLLLKGGASGIRNKYGSFLTEDIIIYFTIVSGG